MVEFDELRTWLNVVVEVDGLVTVVSVELIHCQVQGFLVGGGCGIKRFHRSRNHHRNCSSTVFRPSLC